MKNLFAIAAIATVSFSALGANADVPASVIKQIHANQAANRVAVMEYVNNKREASKAERLQKIVKDIHAKQAANRVAVMEQLKLQEQSRSELGMRK